MKTYFAYIRVSTSKQGTEGVSLFAQRNAITTYAQENDLRVLAWFEEQKTAAQPGRLVFDDMINLIERKAAHGIILHKIDRGARNLRDWARIGELIDKGIDVRFADNGLDLHTRGGRLAADIQAVIAADFIRNLREETRKGILARIEQGFWPYRAPLGYADNGPGTNKTICPIQGALAKEAFEKYATGNWSLRSLASVMNTKGLRNCAGGPVDADILSKTFRNQFYVGILSFEKHTYRGTHEPLISQEVFTSVAKVLARKRHKRAVTQCHRFSTTFRCVRCKRYLIAEKHKGHVYYRCHTRCCLRSGFREELVIRAIAGRLVTLGKLAESSAVESGDILKIRQITSRLSGTISFGNAQFSIDPQQP